MLDLVEKFVSEPTPETREFWDGAGEGRLVLQRCRSCENRYFYPRPFCPACGDLDVESFDASGDGTLHSYVINHRLPAPGFEAPYVIAVVKLAEGPQMMSNIVNVEPDPENLELDMPLRVVFESRGEVSVPLFEPSTGFDRGSEA